MKLTEKSVTELLAAFRSSDPTPGGGSASALAGAIGASLLAMVGALPKPRAATEEDVERLQAARTRCAEIAGTLETLIDRDSEAYELVVGAYKLPKSTEAEKASRGASIQDALRAATDAPLQVMRACHAATEQGNLVAAYGNRNAASDVQVGLELLLAGLRGARQNVEINLGSVTDAAYAASVRAEAESLAMAAEREVASARKHLTEDRSPSPA